MLSTLSGGCRLLIKCNCTYDWACSCFSIASFTVGHQLSRPFGCFNYTATSDTGLPAVAL